METNRGKAILQRWKDLKLNDPKNTDNNGKVIPLEKFIDLQYRRYLEFCFGCNELPLTKGPWMRQLITTRK